MIAVVAKVPLREGQTEAMQPDVQALLEGVAKEPGTIHYSVNIDGSEPDTLVFIERYKDMDALTEHSRTPHFKEFMGKVMGAVAGEPEIKVYQEVDNIDTRR
ncbi:MAG: putative quinol monooxygenase [Desulfatibacillaceae bacterium]